MGLRGFRDGIVVLCLLGCAALAGAAPAVADDPAAAMYSPNTVDVIYLTLPQASEEALASEPDEYVEGTFSLAQTDGTTDGVGSPSTPITVGIRLKGKIGSSRTLDQKAAFKIKFSFVKGQKFLGLKKLTLNNMVQDPSMIHERLAYEAFRSTGVQASRTGYAYVYMNGEDFGMHLNIETLDDIALAKRFGDFDHLYEASYENDVETGPADEPAEVAAVAGEFEIDEGDEDQRADLEALIELVNRPGGGDWSARVEPLADLKEMTRMWALEKYIGHWDGYSGQKATFQPNNYYLMSEPDGRFQMLPWGTDQTWDDDLEFDSDGGVLFSRCLADASCIEMYRRSLREMRVALAGDDLDAQAAATAALLAPWQEMEMSNSRHEHDMAEIEDAVDQTRAFIAGRPGELDDWLATQPPEVVGSQLQVALAPSSLVADGASKTTATATVTSAEGDPIAGDELDSAAMAGRRWDPSPTTTTAPTAPRSPRRRSPAPRGSASPTSRSPGSAGKRPSRSRPDRRRSSTSSCSRRRCRPMASRTPWPRQRSPTPAESSRRRRSRARHRRRSVRRRRRRQR